MANDPREELRKEVAAQTKQPGDEGNQSLVYQLISATVIVLAVSALMFVAFVMMTAFVAFTYKVCALVWNWIV